MHAQFISLLAQLPPFHFQNGLTVLDVATSNENNDVCDELEKYMNLLSKQKVKV